MSETGSLDIGFWFPRPARGARLAEELRRRGHRVTIYHRLPVPGDQRCVRRVDYNLLKGLRTLRTLRHDVFFTSRSFVPVLQLRLNRRPYVYTINGAIWAYYSERRGSSPFAGPKAALYPWLLRFALGGAGAVVANSSFLAESLKARFPGHASKVSTVYNGIDYDAIDAGRPRPDAWPYGGTRILSVVTLNFARKVEGVRLVLDAFEIIWQTHRDASLVIAAKSDSLETVTRLREHIGRLDCADRIRLDVNREDVPDLLAATDLFLYATPADSSDSLPRALLEAQAAGVPTVTTDTVGCGEAVLDNETGRVVPYSAAAMANAGIELLADRDYASRMAATGKLAVRRRFGWEAMAGAYEEVFLRVAAIRHAKPVKA